MKYTLGKFKSTDVFVMTTMLSKIGLGKMADGFGKDNIMQIIAENKGKKKEEIAAYTGMQMVLKIADVVLSNLDKCETEVFNLLSSVTGADVEELRELDAEEFFELVVEVATMQQFKDFFKVASRFLNTAK